MKVQRVEKERRVVQVDNNNPNPQPAPNMAVDPQAKPQVAMDPNMSTKSGGSEKKMALWLIIGLVVIILAVGGIYFYLSSQQKNVESNLHVQPPKSANAQELESDLDSVNVEDVDKSFSGVDQDLQNL